MAIDTNSGTPKKRINANGSSQTPLLWLLPLLLAGCIGAQPPVTKVATPPIKKSEPWEKSFQSLSETLYKTNKDHRTGLAELGRRVAQQENQIHMLRGELEVVRHENQTLKENQANLKKVSTTTQPYLTATNQRQPDQASLLIAPTLNNNPARGGTSVVVDTPMVAHKAPAPITEQDLPPKEMYKSAFLMLSGAQYPNALTTFTRFLKKYPDDPLADNAQYWIGEVHYVQHRYLEALKAFNEVLRRWQASDKVPGSLLKIGFSFQGLGDIANARDSLTRLITDYPANSTEVKMAKKRLREIDKMTKP